MVTNWRNSPPLKPPAENTPLRNARSWAVALLGVAERLQGGDAAAQRGVGGAVQAEVDVVQLGDAAGVEGEGGGPVGGAGVGAGPDPGQAVELADRGGDPVLGRRRRRRPASPTVGALVVDPLAGRGELGAEADVAAEQTGGQATLGLQLLHQVLHRQSERDGAGGGGGGRGSRRPRSTVITPSSTRTATSGSVRVRTIRRRMVPPDAAGGAAGGGSRGSRPARRRSRAGACAAGDPHRRATAGAARPAARPAPYRMPGAMGSAAGRLRADTDLSLRRVGASCLAKLGEP